MTVGMFTRRAAQCGIAVYSERLAAALAEFVEVRPVDAGQPPEEAAARLNKSDVAHIQHSYAFWGRLAWHRSTYGRFMGALRAPSVMTVHELVEPGGSIARRAYLRWLNRQHFLRPQLREFVVHAPGVRDGLVASGIASGRVHLLPMPAPPALPMPTRAEARRRLRLPEERPVIGIFGFLVERKGYRVALEALERLPEAMLLLAGGPHPDDRSGFGEALAAAAGRGAITGGIAEEWRQTPAALERTRVTGFLAPGDVAVAMAAVDVAWAPFLEMAGSASAAETLAYGVPIIASDLPPLRELAAETRAVECVSRGDPAALAEATRRLLVDAPELARRCAAAREYAERTSFRALALATATLYEAARQEA